MSVTKEKVLNALKEVIDPELGIDLVSLGMVYDVRIKYNFVELDLTLTSPGCPIASQILADSEQAVLKIPTITNVRVDFVFNPPWTPERISPEAKARLGI